MPIKPDPVKIDAELLKLLDEVGRLKALHDLSLLDGNAETVYDRFTHLAHRALSTPVSLVSLVAEDHQYFKSEVGLPEPWKSQRKTPLTHSFCMHVVATNEPLIVENAPEHELVKDNLAIRDLNVIAYLGMPLTLNDGTRLGSFCAIDSQPKVWDDLDIAIMGELSEVITAEFNQRAKTYVDQKQQSALDDMHRRIDALIADLDPSLSKADFLAQLRKARQNHGFPRRQADAAQTS